MKCLILCGFAVLVVGCSSATLVGEGDGERKPVIDNWQNISLYYSPPANYEVIGMVTAKGHGLGDQNKMENALEALKEKALEAGATGILLQTAGMENAGAVNTGAAQVSGTGIYGVGVSVPISEGSITGQAIYVPADAANFLTKKQAHESQCDTLSASKDSMKTALKATKKTGTPAEIDATKQKLQSIEDSQDASYCDDDAWFAKQMQANQQLMDKMRAEDQAATDAEKKKADADHEAQCLEAAKNNDLATWRKLDCK